MRRLFPFCLLILSSATAAAADPPKEAKGQRVALTDGQLFIPEGFKPAPDGVDLTLHLHGAAAVAERNFMTASAPVCS